MKNLVEVLLKFEEICLESGKEFAPMFSKVLEELYEKEILTKRSEVVDSRVSTDPNLRKSGL